MKSGISYLVYLLSCIIIALMSCNDKNDTPAQTLQLIRVKADDIILSNTQLISDIPVNSSFFIEFTNAVDTTSAKKNIFLVSTKNNDKVSCDFEFSNENKTIILTPLNPLINESDYSLEITRELKGSKKESFAGIKFEFKTEPGILKLVSASLNGTALSSNMHLRNISYNNIELIINFSHSLDPNQFKNAFSFYPPLNFDATLSADGTTVTITNNEDLDYYSKYSFYISPDLVAENGFSFKGFLTYFYTGLNPSVKMPQLSDEELLTLVQQQTFRYFWDFAHPVSGLARERNSSGETVTTGGSGFGMMAIITGIERNFITRNQGVERLHKIINFLTNADRFHGVWPHWLNGSTGKVIPFSTKDNGGDLVETSFLAAGLITVRQYLNPADDSEEALITGINNLLNTIEWSWYTRGGQEVLYWHWSPNYGWEMNMQIKGYNEALITYFLAASSDAFPVDAQVYHKGWAGSSYFVNGKSFYGIQLPLGFDYGGPLFFAHYSFLGLNPVNLTDQYASYWIQNVSHTLINMQHCIVNQKNYTGYSVNCWGLTASDDPAGYKVHEPTRDNGTITPSAAISSMPFTPEESIKALKHFYYVLGDKLWGPYGFYDAFNPHEGWWANSYIAIDQGPVIVMIENYRSTLCWNLFMSAPEVQQAMIKLGFSN
ncbi:MAG: glucoamylase family protein [Bacteroidales bacterium]